MALNFHLPWASRSWPEDRLKLPCAISWRMLSCLPVMRSTPKEANVLADGRPDFLTYSWPSTGVKSMGWVNKGVKTATSGLSAGRALRASGSMLARMTMDGTSVLRSSAKLTSFGVAPIRILAYKSSMTCLKSKLSFFMSSLTSVSPGLAAVAFFCLPWPDRTCDCFLEPTSCEINMILDIWDKQLFGPSLTGASSNKSST